jgi:uncharacterized protein (UPF0333 family)
MDKKGQGAMEYLMTYGWAILVVIIVGVVLWQMGIFNPSGGTAPGSSGFGSVRAKDWSCSIVNGPSVQWVNGAGEKITVTVPTGATCVDPADGSTVAAAGTFNASANAIFVCTWAAAGSVCSDLNAGDRYEFTADLSWQPAAGGIAHTESGKVWKATEA